MFKRKFYLIVIIIALMAVVQLALGAKDSRLNSKMRALAASLNALLPEISSKNPFDKKDQETTKRIEALSKAVDSVGSELNDHERASKLSSDPIYSAVLTAFRDDVQTASRAYKLGRVDYAKALLRNSVTYCTTCHTRHESSTAFSFPIFAEVYEKLSLTEKMKMLAAARRFEDAIDLFESSADFESMSQVDNFELEGATRLAIAIMVRVQQDPNRPLDLIRKVKSKVKRPPEFFKELDSWSAALNDWKAEKPVRLQSENDYLNKIDSLLRRARERQEYPFDQQADVDYLRATALMHLLLEKYPKSKKLGYVLLNLGKAYEVLQDLGFWSLHENYYEACIRLSARSVEAKECFTRYEDNVVMGYTGSAGTNLPADIKMKIEELRKLAFQ